MALEEALCCFNSKTALFLEQINIFLTSITIILGIIKLLSIQWGATSYGMECLAVFNFIFIGMNLVFVFFFFMLRLKNMVNESNYQSCYYICILNIFISFLACFFEILLMFVTLGDLYSYTGTYYTTTHEVVVSDGEWFLAFFTIVPSVILWFIIFMLWVSELLRVSAKTSGAYDDYLNDSTEVVIINRGGNKNNVQVFDEKGHKIGEKSKVGENVTANPKNISAVSITYA